MGQLGPFLRVVAEAEDPRRGHSHWCPACQEMHWIPGSWSFDGNAWSPTFTPSVKITGKHREIKDGEWTGEYVRDAQGNALDHCCHYIVTRGQINFCRDCTHELAGTTVPMTQLADVGMADPPPPED
jgi:hypothetical protein